MSLADDDADDQQMRRKTLTAVDLAKRESVRRQSMTGESLNFKVTQR